jgi:sec-independent protein translocase protein TatA
MTTFAYFTSTQDWLIVGVIVLVLFGSTKIPQFAKGIGEGIREFKKSINGEDEAEKKVATEDK